jgi:hypothetical protein
LIELFQKFVEHEAKPRTNAKASAFAYILQNHEALLRDFGQIQYFPNVGKYCALSLRALRRARIFTSALFFLSDYITNDRNRNRDRTDDISGPKNVRVHNEPIKHRPGFDRNLVYAESKRQYERNDADY